MKIDLTLGAIEHQQFHTVYHALQKRLQKTSRLNESDLQNILITYFKFVLANGKRAKQMTRTQFSTVYQVYFGMPDVEWVNSLITYVDPNSKNSLSPEGFVKLIEIWTLGNLQDKINLCFGVYDVHGTGFITRDALRKYCRNAVFSQTQEETEELESEYVDFLLRRMDLDRDGKISFDDYSKSVEQSPSLLEFLGQVIPDLSHLDAVLG